MQNYSHSGIKNLIVKPRPGHKTQGLLNANGRVMLCALGRSGIGNKRGEGDGITPIGRFSLVHGMVRTDRLGPIRSIFDFKTIEADDGWCDETGDKSYNQPVKLPYGASHEVLMREDHLYDVALVMDFNIRQRLSVGGSAIFFHLAHHDYRPTEGCVAISLFDMMWLLPRLRRDTVMVVG